MLRPLRRRGKAARHALRAIDLLQGVSQEQAAFVLQKPREALALVHGAALALRDPRLSQAGNWLAKHLTAALEMCENGALEAKRISRAKPCGIPSIRICLSTHAAKSRRRGRVQRLAQPFAGHSCFGAGSVGGELNPWTKTKFFLINFCNFPFRFWSNLAQ